MDEIVQSVKEGTLPVADGLEMVWELCDAASKRKEPLDIYVRATDTIMRMDELPERKMSEDEKRYYLTTFWDR